MTTLLHLPFLRLGVLLLLACVCTARADSLAVARDVPRPAFVILQKLNSSRGLFDSYEGIEKRLPEHARSVARQRYDGNQAELIKAAGDPDWFSESKRIFIQALMVEGRFTVEIRPLPRPGFNPPAIKLEGYLTPEYRQRLLALLPPPFPDQGGPREWLFHDREGWKSLLAFAAASPAQFEESVTALSEHLRPFATKSRLNNQFKPLQDELNRLAELAKVHASDIPPAPLRARVLTNALLFSAAQTAATAAQPEIPAYIYARYEVQAADRPHLPFAHPATAEAAKPATP